MCKDEKEVVTETEKTVTTDYLEYLFDETDTLIFEHEEQFVSCIVFIILSFEVI